MTCWTSGYTVGQMSNSENGEAIVLTIRALHIFSAAVLGLALMGVGSVHARRTPSQSLSAAVINQAACSDASAPKIEKGGDGRGGGAAR
jgi:hypothetical protein